MDQFSQTFLIIDGLSFRMFVLLIYFLFIVVLKYPNLINSSEKCISL